MEDLNKRLQDLTHGAQADNPMQFMDLLKDHLMQLQEVGFGVVGCGVVGCGMVWMLVVVMGLVVVWCG